MFGLLRHIRDKSESDADFVSTQISQDLNHIAQIERQRQTANRRTTARIQRDANLTTDSDEDRFGFIEALMAQDLREKREAERKKNELDRVAAKNERIRKSKNIVSQTAIEKYYGPHRVYSDDELENEHRREQFNKVVQSEDLRPVYPFSLHKNDKNFRIGNETELLKNKTKKNHQIEEFEKLQNDNKMVEILPPLRSSNRYNQNNTKNTKFNKNNGEISLMRLKMAVFKLRLRTDKALYQHFSKKIITQRKKLTDQSEEKKRAEIQKTLLDYYKNKQELLARLDKTSLTTLLQVYHSSSDGNLSNDTPNSPRAQDDDDPEKSHDIDNDPDNSASPAFTSQTEPDDIYNVVTRVEMDSIVNKAELETQTICHYCHYRPLHLYDTSSKSRTDSPLPFTTENGRLHWNIVPTKWATELLKGGPFVQDVELCLFAVKHGLPIIPASSRYVSIHNAAERNNNGENQQTLPPRVVNALTTVQEVRDYVKSAYKQHLPTQSPYQLPISDAKNNTQIDPNREQIVVQLQTDWIGAAHRDPVVNFSANPSDVNTTSFLSTNNGVTLFCKDFYAMQMIVSLAGFHSCYSIVNELEKKTAKKNDKNNQQQNELGVVKQPFAYQIDVYFNTGCCLCQKPGEIDFIHNTSTTTSQCDDEKQDDENDAKTVSQRQKNKKNKKLNLDEIDFHDGQLERDEFFIGELTDSFRVKVEQFTYCVPHMISVRDIELMLLQDGANSE